MPLVSTQPLGVSIRNEGVTTFESPAGIRKPGQEASSEPHTGDHHSPVPDTALPRGGRKPECNREIYII